MRIKNLIILPPKEMRSAENPVPPILVLLLFKFELLWRKIFCDAPQADLF